MYYEIMFNENHKHNKVGSIASSISEARMMVERAFAGIDNVKVDKYNKISKRYLVTNDQDQTVAIIWKMSGHIA